MIIKNGLFTYDEVISRDFLGEIPDQLIVKRGISEESLLFRLLSGNLKITHSFTEKTIIQRKNFFELGNIIDNGNGDNGDTLLAVDEYVRNNPEEVSRYFSINRRNSSVYKELLCEFSNYFYQTERNAHTSAFVHLYRCMEYISYPFPLLYASKTKEYKKGYNSLRDFYQSIGKDAGELAFFRVFAKSFINETLLNFPIKIEFIYSDYYDDIDVIDKLKQIITNVYNQTIKKEHERALEIDESGILSIPFIQFWDFLVTLRNRFFHMKHTGQENISVLEFDSDYLFECLNPSVVNWLSYIYFEIYKYGIENLS